MVDVHVVRKPVACAVVSELGALDQDLAACVVAGEDAVLVVVERAASHREVLALLADARAVLVNHLGPGELDVLDRGVIASDDPDGFALRALSGGVDPGAAAHASEREAARGP